MALPCLRRKFNLKPTVQLQSHRKGKLPTQRRVLGDLLVEVLLQRFNPEEEHLQREKVENEHTDCVIEIEKKLREVLRQRQDGHSIFEVPNSLQNHEPDAFIPHVVSVGPYHRNEDHLQGMETHKWRLLQHVLERTNCPLKLFTDLMFNLEVDTRNCYDKPFKNFNHREFVEMMLLDACFILEWLNVAANGIEHCGYELDDPLFTKWGISPFIQRDLLMLENQIPLFVLNELFRLTKSQTMNDDSVDELALNFFDSVLPAISKNLPDSSLNEQPRLHLLDVVRHALRPSQPNCQVKEPFRTAMHSVTRLRGTSVEFKKKDSTNFVDIEFKKGVLYIPLLVIYDSTKSIFLNLMVFEQHYPQCSNYVTSYVSFMDGLINSAKDVEYLYEKGL